MKNSLMRKMCCAFVVLAMIIAPIPMHRAKAAATPVAYFTFENSDTTSSVGTKRLGASASSGSANPAGIAYKSGGQVDKYITIGDSASLLYVTEGSTITNAFTVELLMRPGPSFANTEVFTIKDGSVSIRLNPVDTGGTPGKYISFLTKTATGTDDLRIAMEGTGANSFSSLTDGDWHHLAFVRRSNGTKEVWIDGILNSGFSKTAPSGNLLSTSATAYAVFNSSTAARKYHGDLDEIALYASALTSSEIADHNSKAANGDHYTTTTTTPPPPPPPDPDPEPEPEPDPVIVTPPPPIISGTYDAYDYAPGANLDRNDPYMTGIDDKPLAQLRAYPLPRYKSGTTLAPNILWANILYQAQSSADSHVENASVAATAKSIAEELAKNWNYAISISHPRPSTDYTNTSTIAGALAQLANQHPEYPLAVLTFRAQLAALKNSKGSWSAYFETDNLPDDHYLQNASGQFINPYTAAVETVKKFWRPSAPITSYNGDGNFVKSGITNLVQSMPNRYASLGNNTINFISENGELYHKYSDAGINADPGLVSAISASGLTGQQYVARRYAQNNRQSYANIIKQAPGAAGAKYSEYAIDGGPINRFMWSEARMIMDPMPNGDRYATPDFYPRWPTNWEKWVSAWHGWRWMAESIKVQKASGDDFYAPFVSAGWNPNPMGNMTPGQWLGLMKVLAVSGAEFFYTGYFNEVNDYTYPCSNPNPRACPDIIGLPEAYTWQNVIPSYAQATMSRVESFYRSSSLMTGTANLRDNASGGLGYHFLANDPNMLIVARKHGSKYLITGALEQSSNLRNAVPEKKNATITLDGQTLTFEVRRQGSTYVYDKTNPSAPLFYQLDAWHEQTHPSWWSKNILVDAELYDSGTGNIKTAGYSGNDFSSAYSFVTSSGTLGYKFAPRATSTTQYLWLRARATAGTATLSAKMNSGSLQTIPVESNSFSWIKMPGNFTGVTNNTTHTLSLTLPGIELDKFILTADAGYTPTGATNSGGNTSTGGGGTSTGGGGGTSTGGGGGGSSSSGGSSGGSGGSGSSSGGGGGSSSQPPLVSPFYRSLTVGDTGADVKALQDFLIAQGLLPTDKNTGFFGPLTQGALASFQASNFISPSVGYFGPLTRGKVEQMLNLTTTGTVPPAAIPPSTTAGIFTRNLTIGMLGEDVRALQQFLNRKGFILVASGPGSPGNETDKFGGATRAALANFQLSQGISPAVGYFGPLTRARVISLMP